MRLAKIISSGGPALSCRCQTGFRLLHEARVFVPLDEHSTPGCPVSGFTIKKICQVSVARSCGRRNATVRCCIAISNLAATHCGRTLQPKARKCPRWRFSPRLDADLRKDDTENDGAQHHGRRVAQRTVAGRLHQTLQTQIHQIGVIEACQKLQGHRHRGERNEDGREPQRRGSVGRDFQRLALVGYAPENTGPSR